VRGAWVAGLAAVAWTLGGRAWLHLRHPHDAHGFDGWYYVLQVRSLLAGEPLFADDSWAFAPMVVAGWALGDVVLGNAVVAIVAAGLTTLLAGIAAGRLGGPWAGAVGAWLAASSTGHLSLSAEFLKNGVGAVPLLALVAWLAGPPRPGLGRLAGGLLLVGLAAVTHKLCGVLALAVLVAWVVGGRLDGGGRRDALAVATVLGMGTLLVLAGTLRTVDLLRGVEAVPLDRWARIRLSSLGVPGRLEVMALHVAPLAVPWVWRRGAGWGLVAAGLVVAGCGPGLPFDFESVAWRLMCMGFVGLVVLAGLLRPPRWVAMGACGVLALGALDTLTRQAARTPDYPAFRPLLETVREHVPPGGLLVAHRGMCGFLWAEGGRRCENFEPSSEGPEVWRVAYGIDPVRIEPFGPVVALRPGYVLVPESVWRRFRSRQAPGSVVWGLRNPSEPRPAWVYGPQGAEGADQITP